MIADGLRQVGVGDEGCGNFDKRDFENRGVQLGGKMECCSRERARDPLKGTLASSCRYVHLRSLDPSVTYNREGWNDLVTSFFPRLG